MKRANKISRRNINRMATLAAAAVAGIGACNLASAATDTTYTWTYLTSAEAGVPPVTGVRPDLLGAPMATPPISAIPAPAGLRSTSRRRQPS